MHTQEIIAMERHNLLVALGALAMFLGLVIVHRMTFKNWRSRTEFGMLIKDRVRLLSLPLLILLPLWWVTVQIPEVFFVSAEVFLLCCLFALFIVVEPLRMTFARRYALTGWLFPVLLYTVPLAGFFVSVTEMPLLEGANLYALGTVVVFFLFLHIVYMYLFRWAQIRHPLASVLRQRLGVWVYLGVLGATLYFAALRPHFATIPAQWSAIFAGMLVLLAVLVLSEAVIASIFDFYFPVARRAEIPTFFRDLVRGLVFIGMFLGFMGLVLKRDLNSLLVGSAVITVSIGFALQETLGNFFAGLALRLSRPYALGDDVLVGQVSGRVDKIDWRQTSILTWTGDHVNLPNSLVAKEGITNYSSPTVLHARDLRIGLHYRHPPNKVIAVIKGVLAEVDEVRKAPAPEVHVLDFMDSSILYRIRMWIEDYPGRWNIETSVRVGLWYAFRREGLEIPFPIRTLVHAPPDNAQDKKQVISFLASVDFLEALGQESLEILGKRAQFQVFAAGEKICRQGESGDSFYIIRAGRVGVEVRDAQGEVFLRNEMALGNYFGEMALLTGEPRSATVYAITDAELLTVDKEDLRDVIVANREVEEIISKVLAQRQLRTEKAREEAEGARAVKGEDSAGAGGRLEQLSEQLLRKIQAFFSY
jgi:small-conductance mechanosensitive channel/CRP-like cAMP-binding protein